MVLKGVNYIMQKSIRVHMDKSRYKCKNHGHMSIGYTLCKNQVNGLERSQLGYTMQKSGHMVLKGVNWVHIDKIRSNGLETQ